MSNAADELIEALVGGIQKQSENLHRSIQDAEFSIGYHSGFADGLYAGRLEAQKEYRRLLGFDGEEPSGWDLYEELKNQAEKDRTEELAGFRK